MSRFVLALALLALGLSAYSAVVTTGAVRETKAHADAEAAIEARLLALETALSAREAAAAPAPALAGAPSAGAGPAPAPPGALAAGGRPASLPDVERRLADLEKSFREAVAGVAEPHDAVVVEGAAGGNAEPETWIGSVEEAVRHLNLAPAQRAEFERVLADAKRERADLHRIPDATGRTWDQVEKDSLEVHDGTINFDATRLQAFRETVIPGRNESFGAAERRIHDEAKRRLRESLNAEQQVRFDRTRVDNLLPGSGMESGFLSVFTTLMPPPAPPPPTDAPTPDR